MWYQILRSRAYHGLHNMQDTSRGFWHYVEPPPQSVKSAFDARTRRIWVPMRCIARSFVFIWQDPMSVKLRHSSRQTALPKSRFARSDPDPALTRVLSRRASELARHGRSLYIVSE